MPKGVAWRSAGLPFDQMCCRWKRSSFRYARAEAGTIFRLLLTIMRLLPDRLLSFRSSSLRPVLLELGSLAYRLRLSSALRSLLSQFRSLSATWIRNAALPAARAHSYTAMRRGRNAQRAYSL